MEQYIKQLFAIERTQKRLLMMLTDGLSAMLAVWLAYALHFNLWLPEIDANGYFLSACGAIVSVLFFNHLGLYHSVVRFMDNRSISQIIQAVSLTTLSLFVLDWFANSDVQAVSRAPKSIYPLFWGIMLLLVSGSRYLVHRAHHYLRNQSEKTTVIIYGAGNSGLQLALSLQNSLQYRPVAFVDDNPILQRAVIHGLKIHSPEVLTLIAQKHGAKQILLAMPGIGHARRSEILKKLEPLKLHVRSIPGLNDLITGKSSIDQLREIGIEELLGRERVDPNYPLLTRCITGNSIMVTGAGGSIGAELCQQIIRLGPKKVVLFELNEFALYQIEQQLHKLCQQEGFVADIIPILGSVQDQQRLTESMQAHGIDTLYHAAAYKHVPLVEHNPVQGIENNTLGTYRTALSAQECGVRHFVLISTDKAVRPTNIMGASKRMAELCLQALAEHSEYTIFSMVRFGNVLGSSGSVVPLFREQIQQGGPLTITHPDITRFFMTIPEAAQLVIQAGSMAKGGDVFLLDMGEEVKIVDLARRMIHLSGLSERNEHNPEGDIRLAFTGLRPGEKLFEELLIDQEAKKTLHPRIFSAYEPHINLLVLKNLMIELEQACQHRDLQTINRILKTYVSGFKARCPALKTPTPLPSPVAPVATTATPIDLKSAYQH